MLNKLQLKRSIINFLAMAAFILPQYPQAEKVSEQKMRVEGANFIMAVYKTPDPIEKVIDFYKGALGEDFEFRQSAFTVIFTNTKDEIGINLTCNRNPFDNTTVFQAFYNSDSPNSLKKAGAPAEEIVPKDIYWLRPYPGSQSLSYLDKQDGFRVTYNSNTNCEQCIADYYRREFLTWGWELIKEGKKDFSAPQKAPEGISQDLQKRINEQIALAPKERMTISYYLMMFTRGNERCAITVTLAAANQIQTMIEYQRH